MPEMKSLTLDGITYDSFVDKTARSGKAVTPERYGAKGDGSTDDTVAFQTALAENRVVFVPGGTYKLSGELKIGHHCELQLSPDTVMNFTQTTGNCITLGMFSSLKGNHAVVNVPYGFTGNVICADSANHESSEIYEVAPWKKWDPQWKYGRYITDLCICKKDSRGFHYSVNGDCNGTAVYIAADGGGQQMWGLHYSGLMIAGAFSYGIHGVCKNEAWVHEMRIDAFIDACEIGVCLEKCNQTYISAVIQPRCNYTADEVYGVYAKQGIKLVDCINTDLSGSRVWDWYNERTACDESVENRSIAMYGGCRGTIINDFVCYWSSTNFKDTRNSIYTDTPSNLETLTIIQEPITRWFKPKDGEPYFFDGNVSHRIAMKDDIDSYFDTNGQVQAYTDVKSPYQMDVCDNNGTITSRVGNLYIEPKEFSVGDVVRIRGLDFTSNYPGMARVYYYYKDSGAYKSLVNLASLITASPTGSFYNNEATYEWDAETKTLTVTFVGANAASFTKTYKYAFGAGYASGYSINDVIMTINEEIKYTKVGLLADGIKVKAENVIGGGSGGGSAEGAVLYTEQELTPEQQEQARNNIGAATESDVSDINTGLDCFTKITGVLSPVYFETIADRIITNSGKIGTTSSANKCSISSHIPVIQGETVYITASEIYANAFYAFYKGDGTVVSIEQDPNNSYDPSEIVDKAVVVPAGAETLVISFVGTTIGAVKRNKPSGGMKLQPWKGRIWTVVGDSLTEKGSRTDLNYHDYIAEATGITVINQGYSGSGYAQTGSGKAFHLRIDKVPANSDVVTIFGSFNDYSAGIELGTPSDTGTETICGCINTTIDNLIAVMPAVCLGIVTPTPWKSGNPANPDNEQTKYADALVEICKNRSIPCLDLYRCSNLRPWSEEGQAACYSKDNGAGCHPDETGHKLIAARFKAFLESLIL